MISTKTISCVPDTEQITQIEHECEIHQYTRSSHLPSDNKVDNNSSGVYGYEDPFVLYWMEEAKEDRMDINTLLDQIELYMHKVMADLHNLSNP